MQEDKQVSQIDLEEERPTEDLSLHNGDGGRGEGDGAGQTEEDDGSLDEVPAVPQEFFDKIETHQQELNTHLSLQANEFNVNSASAVIANVYASGIDRNILQNQFPELFQKIVELEAKIELAIDKRKTELYEEILGLDAIKKALGDNQVDLTQAQIEVLDADKLVADPESKELFTANGDGTAFITTESGKKSTLALLANVALMVIAMSQNDYSMLLPIKKDFGWIYEKIGIDPEIANRFVSNGQVSEQILYAHSEKEIIEFFERRLANNHTEEIVLFLEGLSKDTRVKLLNGERVSGQGPFSNSHQLEEPLIEKVLSVLRPRDIDYLELQDVISSRNKTAN